MTFEELVAAVAAVTQPGDTPSLYRATARHGETDIRIDSTDARSWLATVSYLNDINGFGMEMWVHIDDPDGGMRGYRIGTLPQDPIYDEGV